MARLARAVAVDQPHHITQRGNGRQQTFFGPDDYRFYRALITESCERAKVSVLAYCLMPNHIHFVMVPSDPDGLRAALADVNRRYARFINARNDWGGFFWQGRFASVVLDERHLINSAKYIELNPFAAGLAAKPEDWEWSSARAHLTGESDGLVDPQPLLDRVPDWKAFLAQPLAQADIAAIESAERTGRPLGSPEFVKALEERLGRTLAPQKRGRKPGARPSPASSPS